MMEFSMALSDQPGELARVSREFSDRGINISTICAIGRAAPNVAIVTEQVMEALDQQCDDFPGPCILGAGIGANDGFGDIAITNISHLTLPCFHDWRVSLNFLRSLLSLYQGFKYSRRYLRGAPMPKWRPMVRP